MTDEELNNALDVFEMRSIELEEEYIRVIAEHLKQIGMMSPTDVHRLTEMNRLTRNIKDIQKQIAKMANRSLADIEELYERIARTDRQFAQTYFGRPKKMTASTNSDLRRMVTAQYRQTAGWMRNLSNTTVQAQSYQRAVDKAVHAVTSGTEDYQAAIRHTLSNAAKQGLLLQFPTGSKVLYESGYVRRLDTAVRMNVLDGARQLSHEVLMQAGEEFGADGVEISAHALCAPDHLPYQGLQFSNESFERLQRDLPRPFMQWNCKHTTFPIIMGVSERTYSNEQLAEMRRYSNEKFEYDGSEYTRYEMSQLMRQCETSIRGQKNIALAAKTIGDTQLRRESQAKINALKSAYAEITQISGLSPKKDLMSVSRFKAAKATPTGKTQTAKNLLKPDGIQTKNLTNDSEYGKITLRGMPNGLRQSPFRLLNQEDIEALRKNIRELNADESVFSFNKGHQTSYNDLDDIIYVCGDVLPATDDSHIARDRMSAKAVLAHEYYGHRANKGTELPPGSWEDEYRASYFAAINAPGLSNEDKMYLLQDALDRAREAGQTGEFDDEIRRMLYGYQQ